MRMKDPSKSVKKQSVETRKPNAASRVTENPAKDTRLSTVAPEPLVTAQTVHEHTNLERRAIYSMAQKGLIPSYRTGANGGGVRFRISEVLSAIRRPAKVELPTATSDEKAKP